jgi:hypothetical protein
MYQLYIDYFLRLCQVHPSLLHTDTQRVFEVVSVEEALGDYRGKVSGTGFYFRLMDYTWGVGSTGAFQFQAKQGGFIIGKKVDARNGTSAGRTAARDQCESMVNDFVAHMLADSRAGHPLFSHGSDELALLKLNVAPLFPSGDGSHDALACTFEFFPAYSYELDCHPVPEWRELSPFDQGG